ncbi:hypothetical protein [Kibdelosporangium aridum]
MQDSVLILPPTSATSKQYQWRATATELVLVDDADVQFTLRRQ